jgi:hypothetical protein
MFEGRNSVESSKDNRSPADFADVVAKVRGMSGQADFAAFRAGTEDRTFRLHAMCIDGAAICC